MVGKLTYHEYRFWSPVLGENASRLAITDKNGGEHFMVIVMNGSGKHNRQARMEALGLIAEHIERGCEPGQVEAAPARTAARAETE